MELEENLPKKIRHDIRNNVAIIEMYATLLKEELEEDGVLEKYRRECFVITNSAKLISETFIMLERILNIKEVKNRSDNLSIKEIVKEIDKKNIKGYNITARNENININKIEFMQLLNIILECLWNKIGVKNIFFNIIIEEENIIFDIIFEDPKNLINMESIFNKTNKNITYSKEKATGLEFPYLKKFIEIYNAKIEAKALNNMQKKITLIFKKGE